MVLYLNCNHLFLKKSIVRKFITLFKISLGPILMFFSILCLRFEAVYFSPLPKPTANLPEWMEVGVRFLVAVFQASSEEKLAFVCVTWEMTETRLHAPLNHMESGPRSMVTSEERADGTRGKWQITPLCNFITGAMRWSHLTESISTRLLWVAFPGMSVLRTLTHLPEK